MGLILVDSGIRIDIIHASPTLRTAAFRRLLARSITPRKTIDTLIATCCIVDRLRLLYSDHDFDPFVEHLGLRSALDLPTEGL